MKEQTHHYVYNRNSKALGIVEKAGEGFLDKSECDSDLRKSLVFSSLVRLTPVKKYSGLQRNPSTAR